MHWVVHASVFSETNLRRLLKVLDRAELPSTLVSIDADGKPEPDLDPVGAVYVCGAQRAARLAQDKGWSPGSFLNDNFSADVWQEHLADELLNDTTEVSTVGCLLYTSPSPRDRG